MAIKLTTKNKFKSFIKLSKYGTAIFNYYTNKVDNNLFPFLHKIIKNDNNNILYNANDIIKYVNETFNTTHIQNLKVHIDENLSLKNDKISENQGSFYHDFYKTIVMETESIINLYPEMQKEFGLKKIVQHVFFHEFGHYLEQVFKNNNIEKSNHKFLEIFNKNNFPFGYLTLKSYIEDLQFKDSTLKDTDLKTLLPIEKINNLIKLKEEIYADLSSVMNMRNYELKNNTYNDNNFFGFIQSLSNHRANDYLLDKDTNKQLAQITQEFNSFLVEKMPIKTSDIWDNISHLTSPALDALKNKKDIPNRILTQEEIHTICSEISLSTISKFIYVFNKLDPDFEFTLKVMSHSSIISPDNLKNINTHTNEKFSDFMNFLNLLIGEDSIKNIEKKINTDFKKDDLLLQNVFNSIFIPDTKKEISYNVHIEELKKHILNLRKQSHLTESEVKVNIK